MCWSLSHFNVLEIGFTAMCQPKEFFVFQSEASNVEHNNVQQRNPVYPDITPWIAHAQMMESGSEKTTPGSLKDLPNMAQVKQFKCSMCGLCVSSASNLRRHNLIHTGERRFQCPLCPAKYSQNHHLKRHLKRHPPL